LNKKDLSRLAARLAEDLPGLRFTGPLLYFEPPAPILRALYLESHSYDARQFYLWAFVLVPCVPARIVSFNFGWRIGPGRGNGPWSAASSDLDVSLMQAIRREALPRLSSVRSASDLAPLARTLDKSRDPYVIQAIAYALMRECRLELGMQSLDALLGCLDASIGWQAEIARRAQSVRALIVADSTGAQAQLEQWEIDTLDALKLASPAANKQALLPGGASI
jgi:hypothetical protein